MRKNSNNLLIIILCSISIFILEMLGTINLLDVKINILYSFLFSMLLGTLLSSLYLLFKNYAKTVIIGIIFCFSLVYFLSVSSFEMFGTYLTIYDLFQRLFINDYIVNFHFELYYLFFMIPTLICLLLPNKASTKKFNLTNKLLLTSLLSLGTFIVLTFININSDLSFTTNNNLTTSLYNFGYGFTSLKQFDSNDDMTISFIDNNFNDDYPKEGYLTKRYKDKNIIMLDVRGLTNSVLETKVMQNVSSLENKSIRFSNFFTSKGISENNHLQLQTGFYPENKNQYSYLDTTYSDEDFTLTKLFKKNGYITLNFTNTTSLNSYYLADSLNYGDNGYYTGGSEHLFEEVSDKTTDVANFFYHVTIDDTDILNSEILEEFKDLECTEDVKKILSHYRVIDNGIAKMINELSEKELMSNTVIMIYNSTYNKDVVREFENKNDYFTFVKTPLIFIDYTSDLVDETFCSFSNIYSGIIDAFDLKGQDVNKSVSASIFHNPYQSVYLHDGSVMARDFTYLSKYDKFTMNSIADNTEVLIEIAKNKFKVEYFNNELSKSVKNVQYYHMKLL